MFDKIIDFFIRFIHELIPWFIVKEYERAIILRFGRYYKTYDPGIHFKLSIIDEPLRHSVVTTTMTIPAQSITTIDEKQLVVKAIVKFNIEDIKLFLLEVNDSKDAISDTAQSIIKEQVNQRTWKDCNNEKLDNEITKKLRNEVKKWGIYIEKVTLTDIGIIRSLRLFNETELIQNS